MNQNNKNKIISINLITGNPNKVREFKLILEPEINVNHIDFPYPELRSDDPEEITMLAAKQVAEKLKKTVVVEDSGLFITKLNDFPGTCTKYVRRRITNKGFLKLMEQYKGKDRQCFYKSAIGFCVPGKEPLSFLGVEEGLISENEKGTKGWGEDPIFVPVENNPQKKTYGEIRQEGSVNLFRKRALLKLKEFLLENKNLYK